MFKEYVDLGVINVAALKDIVEQQLDITILDASYALPNSGIDTAANFHLKRIPNSHYFDISIISDQNSLLPHMLPSEEEFYTALSNLGIRRDSFVVVYGQGDMSMGPARAWWMFKTFGHESVVVLDGGFKAWEASGGAISSSGYKAPTPSVYKGFGIQDSLVCGIDEIKAVSLSRASPIVDARPKSRFDGSQPEPRAGLRSGHIPGSHNIPANSLCDPISGCLKPKSELVDLLSRAMSGSAKTYLTCGSGVTACMLALGLYYLGHKNISVYDGSWAEWGLEHMDTPVETTK